jgi:hypothetical protein
VIQKQFLRLEYICIIPEIAEFLGLSDRVIREKAAYFNWQPTGERVQGGGDKYNIDTIRLYKSDEKHQAAITVIKTACNMKRDQTQLAAAAELKTRREAEALASIQADSIANRMYIPEDQIKHQAEMQAKHDALKEADCADKAEQALVLLAFAKDGQKLKAQARIWAVERCIKWLRDNNYPSKHSVKNPDGLNEIGTKAFASEFNNGQISVPDEFKNCFKRAGKAFSINHVSIRDWLKKYKTEGLYGVVGKHKERRGMTKIPPHQQAVIYSMLYEYPHVKPGHIREAVLAKFPGQYVVTTETIGNFINHWKETNKANFLQLTNPDKHRNYYQFAVGKADANITRLNQVWEADSTPADIMCIDSRCSIIGFIDVWPRRVKLLTTPTSKGKAIGALKRRCMLDWGIPEEFHTDNGTDYTGNYIEAVCERLDIYHHICPPFTPEAKPFIERVFKTLSHGIMELLPGYIGHSVKDRKDIEARNSFAKRLMTPGETIEVNMTIAELQKFLDDWTIMYHNKKHSSLGMSPTAKIRTWTEPIRTIKNERALDVLLMESVFRTVTKKGIAVTFKGASMQYLAGEFVGYEGKQVEVFIDETDLGSAVIFSDDRKFICVAQDPAMTGISVQEVAEVMKRKQKESTAEFRKEMKQISKKVDTKNIAQEILKYRLAQVSNVAEFPKKTEEYGTESLSEATTAVAEIERKTPESVGLALTAEQIRKSDELLNKRIPERPKSMLDVCIEYERKIKAGTATEYEIGYVKAYHEYEETGRRTGPLALRAVA